MNWDSFWLNEGFTTFLDWKVARTTYGNDTVNQNSLNGNFSMYFAMREFGISDTFSSLTPKCGAWGINPDDAFSSVPYQKGFQFLLYLESLDGPDKF